MTEIRENRYAARRHEKMFSWSSSSDGDDDSCLCVCNWSHRHAVHSSGDGGACVVVVGNVVRDNPEVFQRGLVSGIFCSIHWYIW